MNKKLRYLLGYCVVVFMIGSTWVVLYSFGNALTATFWTLTYVVWGIAGGIVKMLLS